MLITYGIVDFSATQNEYETYQSNPDQFVKLYTKVLPPFVILTYNSGTSATMDVLDVNGDAVESGISLTVNSNDDKKEIRYSGTVLSAKDCGSYQLKITHGSDIYYSEFFDWVDSLDELVKLTISPYKILVLNRYVVDLSAFTFTQYFKTSKSFNGRVLNLSGETSEDGISKNYGDELLKSTINFENEIEIIGNDASFRFLSMIRPSTVNGSAKIEYNSREKEIYNTTVEQTENSNFGEKVIIKLTFRENSFISNCNE